MKASPAAKLIAAAGILLVASLVPLVPGLGSEGAWSPGGPDAPEPPLSEFWVLWIVAAALFLTAGILSRVKAPVWLALSDRHLGPTLLAAALALLLTEFTGHDLLSLIALPVVHIFGRRIVRAVAASRQTNPERSHLAAEAGANILCAAVALSIAAWLPHLIRSAAGLGPSDLPWLSFWLFFLHACLLAGLYIRQIGANRWYMLSLFWGAAVTVYHNWYVSGLHVVALMTALLSTILLLRVTRAPKRTKPAA